MPFGVFGAHGHGDALRIVYDGTSYMIRRNKDRMVILFGDMEGKIHEIESAESMTLNDIKSVLRGKGIKPGNFACGHVYDERHMGHSLIADTIKFDSDIGIVNNGRIRNTDELMEEYMESHGVAPEGHIEHVELPLGDRYGYMNPSHLLKLMWTLSKDPKRNEIEHISETMGNSLRKFKSSSFSYITINKDFMIGAVDPYGSRSLHRGVKKVKNGVANIISSYTSPLDFVDAKHIEEIKGGNVTIFGQGEPRPLIYEERDPSFCIRELIFFADPNDRVYGISANAFGEECGRRLLPYVMDLYDETDQIIFKPESGRRAYNGLMNAFAEEGMDKFSMAHHSVIIINPIYGKIALEHEGRREKIGKKYYVNPGSLKGKGVMIVDSSLVSADTIDIISKKAKKYGGAKKVFVAIASPEPLGICEYRESMSYLFSQGKEEIKRKCKYVDDIRFLPPNEVHDVTGMDRSLLCMNCFGY